MDLNNETFLATFGNDQDYLRALTGGPWVILDHYLIVHQWSPTFRTSDKPHRSVVAWVQLPELPVHFYHREILFALGNLIGRTIKLDYHTEKLERGKFARIAIELDMTKPLPTKIWLDNFWQQVMYENLPTICYECGQIGHQEDSCPKINQHATMVTSPDSRKLASPATSSQDLPEGFGPWMQVTRKSRKQIRKANEVNNQNRGQPSQNRADSGKGYGSAKGKGEEPTGKGIREKKGKAEQTLHNKKGSSTNQKQDIPKDDDILNGTKKAQPLKEWRPIGTREATQNRPAQQIEASPMTLGSEPSTSGSKQISVTERTQGQQGTTIRVISVPELVLPGKENTNPNTTISSIRQHYQRKKNETGKQEKPRGINVKAAKKPLQIRSAKQQETPQKAKHVSGPITMQSIEEFCSQAQRKMKNNHQMTQTNQEDVPMAETSSPSTANENQMEDQGLAATELASPTTS
ncbi:unnamed protein product [Linum trigynum]